MSTLFTVVQTMKREEKKEELKVREVERRSREMIKAS